MQDRNEQLINDLVHQGVLKTSVIIAAFRAIDRGHFVPERQRTMAYADIPLSMGHGATISQPYTVAVMLEMLQPKTGEHCLDIGAGSGWTAALLAQLVGSAGTVVAVERIPQLAASARQQLTELGTKNVTYITGDASHGWPSSAPYHVIHVAAASLDLPDQLVAQLAPGGRLIIPVGYPVQELVLVTKMSDNTTTERRLPGFQFVPLIRSDHDVP